MQEYWINEGSLLLPDHWRDTTINVFSMPSSKNSREASATFLITRDDETKVDSLNHYADLQLVEAARKLSKYKLIQRRETRINHRPAIEIDFSWRTPERAEIIQRQAYLQQGSGFLIFTFTVQTGKPIDLEGNWNEILASIQLRG
jgi:hypothetical protein